MHSPYLGIVLGAVLIVWGGGVFVLMSEVLWGALLVGGLFVAAGLFILVNYLRRIAGWHRARRAVRDHIEANGGSFPPELRWYN